MRKRTNGLSDEEVAAVLAVDDGLKAKGMQISDEEFSRLVDKVLGTQVPGGKAHREARRREETLKPRPRKPKSRPDSKTAGLHVTLLHDLRAIFEEAGVDRLPSAEIVEALKALEGRPWTERKRGRKLSQHGLARMLKPFGVRPKTIRIGNRTLRGYMLTDLQEARNRNKSQQTQQSATKCNKVQHENPQPPP